MIQGFRGHWKYTWQWVWKRLAEVAQAPPDLFMSLYRSVGDYLHEPPSGPDYDLAINDPDRAREAFKRIKGSDFPNEGRLVEFLEDAYRAIQDFGIERYAARYVELVSDFVGHHNLRYRVIEPFELRPLVTGAFAGLYADLSRLSQADPYLQELLDSFEQSFAAFARSQQPVDLTTCIAKAAIYAEGLAAKTLNTQGGTLGSLCDELQCWPHSAIREALKKVYGFCSNYPGIRHAGNPDGQLRPLETKDALLICVLLMVVFPRFSGHIDYGAFGAADASNCTGLR